MDKPLMATIVAILLIISSGLVMPLSSPTVGSMQPIAFSGRTTPEGGISIASSASTAYTTNPAGVGTPSSNVVSSEGNAETISGQTLAVSSTEGAPASVPIVLGSSMNPSEEVFMGWIPQSGVQLTFSTYSTLTSAIPGLWLDSSKRRTRSQIYIEILELLKRGPMTPFEIAFYARLNRKRTKDYTEFLTRNGYLQEEVEKETRKKIYVLTKEGFQFQERVRALFEHDRSSNEVVFDIAKKSDEKTRF